jgi:hypothetical protein
MFGRKKKASSDADLEWDDDLAGDESLDADEAADPDDTADRRPEPGMGSRFDVSTGELTGPYDAVAPDDGLVRVELGALHVPMRDGLELRVEVDENQQVVGVTLVEGESVMQLGVFAAPKSSGIWSEVRGEILESLTGGGGQAEENDGPFGPQLLAGVPSDVPGQLTVARFVGIDGPRWFLRALFTGPAAVDADAATSLEAVLTGVVVIRGKDAMPIREPLPLQLPQQAVAASEEEEPGAEPEGGFNPLERGPEITEVH